MDQLLAERLKALAHPARLEIVRILAARNRCVCGDVVEVMPLAQATVSQHLKILKEQASSVARSKAATLVTASTRKESPSSAWRWTNFSAASRLLLGPQLNPRRQRREIR